MKYVKWREFFGLLFGSLKIGFQCIRVMLSLSRAPGKIVSIFGGMEVNQSSKYAKKAYECAQMLAARDFAILTGGGPGIMQAANCGAISVDENGINAHKSFGIGVKGVDVNFLNPCASVIKVQNFAVRKWLMIRYSSGFVILPGGFGTGDEFFDLLNSLKTGQRGKAPVILVGVEYWQPVVEWLTDKALKEGFIREKDLGLFFVTDDCKEVVTILQDLAQ
jgi:uncharacterized protein (TIGR00730 family)